MRKKYLPALLLAVFVVWSAAPAVAGKVEVYAVMEEEVSPMELRAKALAEGFAIAVTQETQTMLGGALDTLRLEALKTYFIEFAKPYIQGYNILSSEDVEDGLLMSLDVKVNRRTLRDGLKKLGLFETVQASQPALITWPEEIADEDLRQVQSLMITFGLTQATEGEIPEFALEYGEEKGTYKGRMVVEDTEWLSINKSMGVVWTKLWTRYFSQPKDDLVTAKTQFLTISGWFTPDGVLEFDRVLKAWDSAVQDTKLVEMDIQPTGVGATWDVNILDSKRLAMLLNSFLPQRGLSFQLNREAEE